MARSVECLNMAVYWALCFSLILGFSLLIGCTPKPIYHHKGGGKSGAVASQAKAKASTTPKVSTSQPAVSKSPVLTAGGRKRPAPVVKKPKTAHPHDPLKISTKNAYQLGVASYYGKKFHGRKTANGETFNMYKMTAAHRVLPLGTYVKVTNMSNGRWVEAKINDRGPFIEGRILDLSFGAALELEMVKAGTAEVMIEITRPLE